MPEAVIDTPQTTQTATPPPAAPPAQTAQPPKEQPIRDPFGDIKPAPKQPPAPKAPAKDAPGTAANPEPPTDKGQPGAKAAAGKKDPLAEQRARIEQQNQVIASTTRERDELRERMRQLQERGGGDTQAMAKLLEEERKKAAQLQSEIASRDYSKSDEYRAKYEQPFLTAAEYAREVVESLQVLDEEGNPTRTANWKSDFAAIYSMDPAAARLHAKKLFGDEANTVMAQYYELHKLDRAKQQALTEWQKGAEEREQKTRAEELLRNQHIGQAFMAVTQHYLENDPEFTVSPDDAELTHLRKEAESRVDQAYDSERRSKMPPHELIQLDAAIRLRAINEPVLRAKLAKANEEIAELKARIEGGETSASGKTRHAAPPVESGEKKDFMTDLRETVGSAT